MGTQKLFSPLNYNYELKNREDIYRDKTNSNTVQKYTLLKFKKCSVKFFNFLTGGLAVWYCCCLEQTAVYDPSLSPPPPTLCNIFEKGRGGRGQGESGWGIYSNVSL